MRTYYVTDRSAKHCGSYIDEIGENVNLRINAQAFPTRQAAEARALEMDPDGDWSEIEEYDDGRKRFAMLQKLNWRDGVAVSIITRHAGTWDPLTFDTPRAAREWIADHEADRAWKGQESCLPVYQVTTVGTVRFRRAYLTTTGTEWTESE
jgi:hypothetical protein